MLLGRTNHRRVAWLALFALWLQLALSFGHMHPEDFAGLSSGAAHQQFVKSDPIGDPAAPLDPLAEGPGHEACAICASIHLAGTLTLPEPIELKAPLAADAAMLRRGGELLLLPAPHSLFQTRAPPLV